MDAGIWMEIQVDSQRPINLNFSGPGRHSMGSRGNTLVGGGGKAP